MKNNRNNILLFAGTSEGRVLAEYLSKLGINTYVSVATEYGMESVEMIPDIHILAGRMDQTAIQTFIASHEIHTVIDATHPYAQIVTENIKIACSASGVDYIRCLRESSSKILEDQTGYVMVDSVAEAVEYLNHTKGNILIATGSKEIKRYTAIEDFKERCYGRVLSTLEAIEESITHGFVGAHLIAMQGPFSEELNIAMLQHTKAAYFVTKESGQAGGFKEKLDAAKATGAILVVVGRPAETGSTMEQVKRYIRNMLPVESKRS